jgi:hypothetical protein
MGIGSFLKVTADSTVANASIGQAGFLRRQKKDYVAICPPHLPVAVGLRTIFEGDEFQ